MPSLLYDWRSAKNLDGLRLEGSGELGVSPSGELLVRTHRLAPALKATNVWFRDFFVGEHFRVAGRYRSDSAAGNTMIIFNAMPVSLPDLFADPRPGARYCDLAGLNKIAAYTCGFHRGVFGNDSVLRKIGGRVPADWGELEWPSDAWKTCDQITRLDTTREPLPPEVKGQWHNFTLTRDANRIQFHVNGTLVHDVQDSGQYPYAGDLPKGRLGFRNFGGPAEDFYDNITVELLDSSEPPCRVPSISP